MAEMSLTGDLNGDIYLQIIDLQEKLKQSEAERTRLEEMFKALLKSFKEEEDMRKKYLETRYHSFLDDCAKRNYRNEKILRSVERVENAANVLYAKTERLKLLRNHYEAYLGRVIPAWRQNFSVQSGPNQLSAMQRVEWRRQNQLIPEVPQQPNGSYLTIPPGMRSRTSRLDPNLPDEYFPRKPRERERFSNQFSTTTNYFNGEIRNQTNRYPETWDISMPDRERDRNSPENYDVHFFDPRRNKPTRPLLNTEEMNYDETVMMKGLETALHRKLVLDDAWNSAKNHVYVFNERTYEPNEDDSKRDPDFLKKADPYINETYLHKYSGMNWAPSGEKPHVITGDCLPNGMEGEYVNDRPVITREPVEMKKPEYIVGKLQPEATLKFGDFNKPSELKTPSNQNVKQEDFLTPKPIHPPSNGSEESENIKIKITDSCPPNKWSLLKHKSSINKLKETLYFEEGYDHEAIQDKKSLDDIIKSVGKSYENSVEKEMKNQNENDSPKVLAENWRGDVHRETPSSTDIAPNPNITLTDGNMEIRLDEENVNNEYERQYQEEQGTYPQREENCASNEEGYDDNEETYPESYFEQPPKPDYSRDIVSNVILEEDESEPYMNDDDPEGARTEQNIENEQIQFDSSKLVNNNTEYNMNRSEEIAGNKDQYQNLEPDNVAYDGVDGYANNAEYNNMQQQQYMYENQEYNQNNDYNNIEQYQTRNPEQQEYYDRPGELANYGGEVIEESYENMYNQQQGFENNPTVEQYDETYRGQFNEGEVISNGNYYNQGGYDGAYYESQLPQNSDYPQNEQQENRDVSQGGGLASNQAEDDRCGEDAKNLPLRQSNIAHFLDSDSESFQIEHGSAVANEDSDFDFSLSQKQ